ncbi:interferon lambda receptor 1 [Pelobates fuscus]|uniref:interferon lambda receptor 1 n=1 Tax=Pelobates fuscus TaxID=191477 RepID=UPI002FE4A47E
MLWSYTSQMSIRYSWAFLISQCFVVQIVLAGSLLPPLNVTTVSRNFRIFLVWLPAPENPQDVSYTVHYKLVSETKWKPVKRCKNIKVTDCDITCHLKEYYSNYNIRIRTISKYYMSSWINSEKISYMFTVDPDPPILQITHVDKTMHINATLKKPACIRNYEFDVKYVLEIWKIGKPNESILNITTDNSIVTQETTGLIGTYCVAAQTVYQVDRKKLSKFSSPICQVFEENNTHWGLVIAVFLFGFLGCGFLLNYCTCRMTNVAKTPHALDFTNYKPFFVTPDATLEDYDKFTVTEKKKPHSIIISLSTGHTGVYDDYLSCGFGYTEKHKKKELQSKLGDSTGYTQAPNGSTLSYNSSGRSSSSDFSFGEYSRKSDPTIPLTLTLDNVKIKGEIVVEKGNQLEISNKKSNVERIIQFMENQENVPFDSLWIADQCAQKQSSDCESYDQFSSDNEDSHEQSNEDLTIYRISDSLYNTRQKPNRCTGYGQRGYTARD